MIYLMLQPGQHIYYDHIFYKSSEIVPEKFQKHSHNTFEILFFEKGDATYVIEDKKYKLHKNDLIFIRPTRYHYIELSPDSNYARINIAFDDTVVDSNVLASIPSFVEAVNCPKESVLAGIFTRMEYYRKVLSESGFQDILQALIKEIVYNLSVITEDPTNDSARFSPILSKAIEYIQNNLTTIKHIKEISDHLYVSPQYLFRIFDEQIQITPKKYINTKRLLYAQSLIRQGAKPTEVYLLCGFESYPGFYKQYINNFGYPPSKEKTI